MFTKNHLLKRILSIVMAIVILLSIAVFSGCDKSSVKQTNTLVIWAFDDYIDAAKEAVKEYEKSNSGVKFEIVELGQDDLVEKFKIALASGNKDNLPDVIVEEYYNLKGYLEFYNNYFADLTDYIDPSLYVDFTVKNVTYNDRIWAVPYDTGVGAWFYRKDIMDEAGYSEADLQNITWDEFIEIGKVVKNKTGKYIIPLVPEGNIEGRLMLQSAGEWYYDYDGNLNINNNEAILEMTKTVKKLMDSDVVDKVTSWDDIISSFYNGNSAGVIGGSWWSSIIRDNESQFGLWRVAPPPRMTGSDNYTNYSNCAGCCWLVLNKDNKQTAIDFLTKTIAVSNSIADTMAKEKTVVPALKSGRNTPSATAGDPYFGNQNIVETMAEWSLNVPYVNYGRHPYEIAYYHGSLLTDYIKGKTTIEDVILKLEKQAEIIDAQ